MKTSTKSAFCIALALIGASASAFAQASLPMIKSSGDFRAWARASVTEVNVILYMSSGGNSGYDYRAWQGSKSALDIIAQGNSTSVSVNAIDLTETVTMYVSLNDKDGNARFWGYNNAKPVKGSDGKWTLPASIKDIALDMGTQPLPLDKQVDYADIVAKDSYGNSLTYPQAVNNGKVWFSELSTGLAGAYLRVNYSDGTVGAYDLGTGASLPVVPLVSSPNTSFLNLYSFKDPAAAIAVKVQSDKGKGIVPTIEVTNTGASQNFVFDVATSDGKRPTSYRVLPDGGASAIVNAPAGSTTVSIQLPAGTTDVVPQWAPGDFSEDVQPVATGGGKG